MNTVTSIHTAHLDQAIKKAINVFVLNQRPFTTIEILRESIRGYYHCDTGVPVALSPNANFGKRVAAVCAQEGVRVHNRRLKARDDYGNKTTTTQWAPQRRQSDEEMPS